MSTTTIPRPVLLQSLWLTLTLSFAWCDIISVMVALADPAATAESYSWIKSGWPNLGVGIWMAFPVAMILLSRLLPRRVLRPLGIAVTPLLLLAQVGSVFMPGITPHYAFFSLVEVGNMTAIIVLSWTWPAAPERARTSPLATQNTTG